MNVAASRLLGALTLGLVAACTGSFEFDVPLPTNAAGSVGGSPVGATPTANVAENTPDTDVGESGEGAKLENLAACEARCSELGAHCAPEWRACVMLATPGHWL